VTDLPDRLDKMSDEIKDLKKELTAAQKQLLPIRAAELAKNVHTRGQLRYIVENASDVDPGTAGQLARLAADEIDGLAVLRVGERLVLAVPEKGSLHAGKLARALAEKTDLKGGGSQRQAQLGGAHPERMEEYIETLLDAI
jgi:alanyl-tRNA synthetase